MHTSGNQKARFGRAGRTSGPSSTEVAGRPLKRVIRPSVLVAALLVFFLALPLVSPAAASPLSQKQAELKAARAKMTKLQDSLDALTKKFATAEANLAVTEDAITAVEKDITRTNMDLEIVRAQVS